jgi:hypothetical protein
MLFLTAQNKSLAHPDRPDSMSSAGRTKNQPGDLPAVLKDAFYVYLGSPLPGEGPDGHFPSRINSFGPVSVRIQD